MDCIINSAMFLRSNGNLVCWDDTGCNHVLQAWNPKVDYGYDVFLGPVYDRIRESMRAGHKPFAACREGCLALKADAPHDPSPRAARRLNYFQIESSFACQLACPNCYPGVKRSEVLERTEGGHLLLRPEVLDKIFEDFARAHIAAELIEFQGHGEPLINPHLWDMVRTCRRLQPYANVKVVTNANFEFEPQMAESGISEMVFSIDGVDDPSYLPYRRKGNFDKAYAFMASFCGHVKAQGLDVRTVWKYVLFDHDDSPAQLSRLAELATQARVDEVQLIVTQMGDASRRFLKAFLELQTVASESAELAEMVSKLRFSVSAGDADKVWRTGLGKSPLPEQLVQLRKPKVSLFSYLSLQRDLDHELHTVDQLLAEGRAEEAGNALSAFAHRLWRLYDLRPEMIIEPHVRLVARALSQVGAVPAEARFQTLLKLDVFSPYLPKSKQRRDSLTFWAHPVFELEQATDGSFRSRGQDPQMALFASDLAMPTGPTRIRVTCEVCTGELPAPRLYVDEGRGFTEELSFALGESLRDLELVIDLPPVVRRLRFDPACGEGVFRLTKIEMTELTATL